MCALVAWVVLLEEPPGSLGFEHPLVPNMQRGGGTDRLGGALWLAWGLGALEIAFFVGLIALGARSGRGLRGLGRPLWIGFAAYVALWTALVLTYRSWIAAAPDTLWLALPSPTAVMLYGLWPVPLVFLWLYATGFSRCIYTDEDRRRFEELVSDHRGVGGSGKAE